MNPTFTIGDRIRKAREVAHLDQKELASEVGVSRALISKWERDASEPKAKHVRRIAELTAVDLDWLIPSEQGERISGWNALQAA